MKKLLFLFCLLFLSSIVFGATISSLVIDSNIELGKNLMVFGKYSDATPNILCSFYIFDLHDENQLITRLSDEYTFADGSFSSSTFKINEPELKRGQDYNLFVCCSTACANGVFKVLQKEDIALGVTSEAMIWDLVFWTAPENSFTVAFIFFMTLFIIGIIAFWLRKAI